MLKIILSVTVVILAIAVILLLYWLKKVYKERPLKITKTTLLEYIHASKTPMTFHEDLAAILFEYTRYMESLRICPKEKKYVAELIERVKSLNGCHNWFIKYIKVSKSEGVTIKYTVTTYWIHSEPIGEVGPNIFTKDYEKSGVSYVMVMCDLSGSKAVDDFYKHLDDLEEGIITSEQLHP